MELNNENTYNNALIQLNRLM